VYGKIRYSPRIADIWSLGVILINMITGTYPWRRASTRQHEEDKDYVNFIHDPQNYLRTMLPLSSDVNALLHRIFTINPLARIELDDLRRAINDIDNFFMSDADMETATPAVLEAALTYGIHVSPRTVARLRIGLLRDIGDPCPMPFRESRISSSMSSSSLSSDEDDDYPIPFEDWVRYPLVPPRVLIQQQKQLDSRATDGMGDAPPPSPGGSLSSISSNGDAESLITPLDAPFDDSAEVVEPFGLASIGDRAAFAPTATSTPILGCS
jgi:serine/threonine protein kinase